MSENRQIRFKTNMGEFVAETFEDKAPKTTENFISLVEKKFYDGIIFHRVIDGFTIDNFTTALFASIVYSLISWAGASILLPTFGKK